MSNFNNFSNKQHRYILEKGSKKHHCPDCNKKAFVLYIDTETGDYLPEQYGRCDRESKCSYHLNPYLDGYAKAIWEQEQKVTVLKQKYFRTQPNHPPMIPLSNHPTQQTTRATKPAAQQATSSKHPDETSPTSNSATRAKKAYLSR